ncbi:MAG: DUF4965 domain-containing protein [Bacteroidales bacterium]|nr:DUF4965 domain-containing protein [Bacteroidales bacterium]
MKKLLFGLFSILILIQSVVCQPHKEIPPSGVNNLRAPAYPLVTIDPYTSIWSFTDKLYEENVRHWTGTTRTFLGALRVDGKLYRFMGSEEIPLDPLIFTADMEPWSGRYTEEKPADGWEKPSFDDTTWKEGKGAFGSRGTAVSTRWRSKDIWIRREITLSEDISTNDLVAKFSYDDLLELYINGIQVVKTGATGKMNVTEPLTSEVTRTLKKGKNVIAAHCFNESGSSYVDFGLFKNTGIKKSFEQSAIQKSVNVMPTQTFYVFECGPVKLDLIFTSPLLMNDLDLLSRPVNYITWQAKSLDGKKHDVQIYFEASPEWAVNAISQPVTAERLTHNELIYLKTGTVEQPVLAKKGDDLRIDWGYFYLTGKSDKSVTMSVGDPTILKKEFALNGKLSNTFDNTLVHKLYQKMPALSYSRELGKVGKKVIGGHLMVGYDDILSIQFFGDNLPAYWKKEGAVDILQVFETAENNYSSVIEKCSRFDIQMMADAESAGGKKYAEMCALTYRQSIAAHKLVKGKDGELLFFSKENFSNGCIATVDVTYPSAPLYLLYNPDLLKGMLNGIFYYSESGKWTKPFAAHDLGTFPLANGQVYREDMPVEEAGNMLILTTAIAVREGNAAYAEKHWSTLSTWANYLLENGLDPANQLCTDDFAGHLAHNANLSVKAIMGIAGYGKMASMLGKNDIAAKYTQKAREMANEWIRMDDEADHFRLTFDQPGTWSQKYNLVWNKLLNLNIFPDVVAEKEIAYYFTKQMPYGLPLDSRKTYTKSDWVMWTATLAGDTETFKKLTDPIWKYCNETQTRMPVSDWHETTDGRSVGFRARSVVGGYFMKMLEQEINRRQKQ